MTNRAAQTATGPASMIAAEQYYPEGQRLFHDELAQHFLPPGVRWIVRWAAWPPARNWLFNLSEKRTPGLYGSVLCRKRYITEKTHKAIQTGIGAVVILGAGLDTLAYRIDAAVPVFEVDLPEIIEYKRARLQSLYGKVPSHVNLTPVDFDRQDLGSVLSAQGYQAGTKSLFIWEAVTQYLTEEGVRRTFRFLAKAPSGSRLVFSYIRKDFIEGTNRYGSDALYQAFVVKERLFRFGMEPDQVAPFLQEYGWREVEQLGSQACFERYLKPSGRELPLTEIERIVYAERT